MQKAMGLISQPALEVRPSGAFHGTLTDAKSGTPPLGVVYTATSESPLPPPLREPLKSTGSSKLNLLAMVCCTTNSRACRGVRTG